MTLVFGGDSKPTIPWYDTTHKSRGAHDVYCGVQGICGAIVTQQGHITLAEDDDWYKDEEEENMTLLEFLEGLFQGLGESEESEGIVAQNGTKITGFTAHGVDRAVGDAAQRAGTTPKAILDALKNPQKIMSGVDSQGRAFQIFTGQNARVVVNPQTGRIISVNPLSGAGAH